ncbi:cupin domain-containing protein [Agrobacterium pusense]|uniref:cupin domain-containing protein n=1 Tax=Agrobacterium pusense TaxID=648995 RepID=UPI003FD31C34
MPRADGTGALGARDGRTDRGALSMIYYLLEEHQCCSWHRLDADEMWLWHAGGELVLSVLMEGDGVQEQVLGPESPQGFIRANSWQTARSNSGWVLLTCVACPGFDEKFWELAPKGWRP